MNKMMRTVREAIERGGGTDVTVENGGRHAFLEFTAPGGGRSRVPIHRGTNPKRYEDCLRSQLRRAGLKP